MIQEVAGDILLSQAQVIAHGIAPNDHFASGLALSLRERWPAMYKDFRHYTHQSHPKPGTVWMWGGPSVRIACLLTQEPAPSERQHPGKATLSNVHHCLQALRKECEAQGFQSLALPKLATGVGGLTWSDVRSQIEQDLGDLDIPIILYTDYQANVAAPEALS